MSSERKPERVTSIRLSEELRAAADRIRKVGKYRNRSEAIKAAIALTDHALRRET